MSLKGYRIIPYPLGTPEWESFKNYAIAYYKEAVDIASYVSSKREGSVDVFRNILNATLSPLVFLWEKWQLMSLDDKLKYATPEYAKELERIKAESQQAKDVIKREKWADETK